MHNIILKIPIAVNYAIDMQNHSFQSTFAGILMRFAGMYWTGLWSQAKERNLFSVGLL